MILTFGVLCTMIKRCGTDSATNQAVVSAMVSAIDPNEKYRETSHGGLAEIYYADH